MDGGTALAEQIGGAMMAAPFSNDASLRRADLLRHIVTPTIWLDGEHQNTVAGGRIPQNTAQRRVNSCRESAKPVTKYAPY